MRLSRIHLRHFRNIGQLSLPLEHPRIFLIGKNGQGKSNLLEAMGLITAFRSFRTHQWNELIAHGQLEAGAFFKIVSGRGKEHEIVLTLNRKSGRQIEWNGVKKILFGEFLGNFPTVTCSTDDIHMIRGTPSNRRRHLDLFFSSLDPDYFTLLRSFHQVLRERNAVLKQGGSDAVLNAFDRPFADTATRLSALRGKHLHSLTNELTDLYPLISGTSETGSVDYHASAAANERESFIERLQRDRKRDREQRASTVGPHRDDFIFGVSQSPAKSFASEGQQRNMVLALKLAEFRLLEKARRETPVLLLDDVLHELDPERRVRFWALLPKHVQLVASGTTSPAAGAEDRLIYQVSGGECTRHRPNKPGLE